MKNLKIEIETQKTTHRQNNPKQKTKQTKNIQQQQHTAGGVTTSDFAYYHKSKGQMQEVLAEKQMCKLMEESRDPKINQYTQLWSLNFL